MLSKKIMATLSVKKASVVTGAKVAASVVSKNPTVALGILSGATAITASMANYQFVKAPLIDKISLNAQEKIDKLEDSRLPGAPEVYGFEVQKICEQAKEDILIRKECACSSALDDSITFSNSEVPKGFLDQTKVILAQCQKDLDLASPFL